MGIIFFIPLTLVAFYESTFDKHKTGDWFREDDDHDDPQNRNPEVYDPNCEGLEISKVPFEELIKVFPQTNKVWKTFVFQSSQMLMDNSVYSRVKQVFWKRYMTSKSSYMC